jgi:hypothetical protein
LFYNIKAREVGPFSLAFLGKESHERNQGKEQLRRGGFLYNPPDAMETPSISIRVGYARVSTHEQNLDVQKDAP